jgi:hypothetical protein
VTRRLPSLLATVAVGAALSVPAASNAADAPAWAPNVPWGAGCAPAPTPAQRTASNCGAALVEGQAVPPPGAPPVVKRLIAAADEIERVDHEHLGPVALGDLVHLRMRAALDQERVVLPPDPLQAVEEVVDQVDLEVVDSLEGHVLHRGPLVARARRSERHQRHLPPISSVLPHDPLFDQE